MLNGLVKIYDNRWQQATCDAIASIKFFESRLQPIALRSEVLQFDLVVVGSNHTSASSREDFIFVPHSILAAGERRCGCSDKTSLRGSESTSRICPSPVKEPRNRPPEAQPTHTHTRCTHHTPHPFPCKYVQFYPKG